MTASEAEALVERGACIIWTGKVSKDGYGYGSDGIAHRVAYERKYGPIPTGLQIDHLCRVRNCVNPDHLEPVTRKENILRGESPHAQHARQTHCIAGHPFTPENTGPDKGRGGRKCRACDARRSRERLQRLRIAKEEKRRG